MNSLLILALGITFAAIVTLWIFISMIFRKVVPTNMVHIVQSKTQTTSYGGRQARKGSSDADSAVTTPNNGNVYYRWPSWVPMIGVTVIELPISNFDLKIENYSAYDKDRVPLAIDITAFFRIVDTNKAAERVDNIHELESQLLEMVRGSARSILASRNIDEIMIERDTFGEQFTAALKDQLADWGVETVKNLELMDIRDAEGSTAIHDIMAKKQSDINRESREVIAGNDRAAQEAEIAAQQAIDERKIEAEKVVGQRKAEEERAVGIANEQAQQQIQEEARETAEKLMAVKRVEEVRAAEIAKDQEIVKATEDKEAQVIRAEGQLEEERREAEGIKVKGKAEAEAKKLMELAPIQAQIELAKEIGNNPIYQQYLIAVDAVAAFKGVGLEQAKALVEADLKVIANSGDVMGGVNNLFDLFSAKGGTNLGAMLEAAGQTDAGRSLMERLGVPLPKGNQETGSIAVEPVTAGEAEAVDPAEGGTDGETGGEEELPPRN